MKTSWLSMGQMGLRDKFVNSKHRWPGWPTSVFLVGLTPFKLLSMAFSMVTCRKTSNSSTEATASKMCTDRCCTDKWCYQRIRGCIQTPSLCWAFQNRDTPCTRMLSCSIYSLVKSNVSKNNQQLHSLLPFVLHARMTTFLEEVNEIPEQFISQLTSFNTLTAYQGQIFLQYCFL